IVRITVSGARLLSGPATCASAGGVTVFGAGVGRVCCAMAAAARPERANTRANADNFMDAFIVPGRGSLCSSRVNLNLLKLNKWCVWGESKPEGRSLYALPEAA